MLRNSSKLLDYLGSHVKIVRFQDEACLITFGMRKLQSMSIINFRNSCGYLQWIKLSLLMELLSKIADPAQKFK